MHYRIGNEPAYRKNWQEEKTMDLDMMDYEEFEEGEEGVEEGEGQNRLFIIAVAVMSGVLLIGIIAFCVWVLVVGGFIGGGGDEIVEETETPAAMAEAALTGTAVAELEAGETAEAESAALTSEAEAPTATVEATTPPTPAPTDTPTPIPEEGGEDGEENDREDATEESAGADVGGTPSDVGEVTPTMGPRPSPTVSSADAPPAIADSGIGAFTAVIVAGALLMLLIGVRRLRTAR
jgi:hypothetical protein